MYLGCSGLPIYLSIASRCLGCPGWPIYLSTNYLSVQFSICAWIMVRNRCTVYSASIWVSWMPRIAYLSVFLSIYICIYLSIYLYLDNGWEQMYFVQCQHPGVLDVQDDHLIILLCFIQKQGLILTLSHKVFDLYSSPLNPIIKKWKGVVLLQYTLDTYTCSFLTPRGWQSTLI